jgi:hypothetical protein
MTLENGTRSDLQVERPQILSEFDESAHEGRENRALDGSRENAQEITL